MEDPKDSGNIEKQPDEPQLPAPNSPTQEPVEFIEEPELYTEKPVTSTETPEFQEPESEPQDVDPLLSLRKSLLTEETEPEVKQNLFSRVTGTLSLKKAGLPESTFGVKTAGNPGAGSNDEMQDDFFQQRLGTAQNDPLKVEPKPKEASPSEESEPFGNSIVPVDEGDKKMGFSQSKVTAPNPIAPGWTDDELPLERLEGFELDDRAADSKKPGNLDQPGGRQYRNPQRFIAYNPKQNLWGRIQGLNRVDKILIGILVLAVIALIIFMLTLYSQSTRQQQPAALVNPTVQPTSTLSYPIPSGLHLPGGWSFELKVGNLVDGKWNPQTSEWLVGTEIRRVIAIPWNKQLEAVFQTFTTSDKILLDINNGDTLEYKVRSVTQVPVTDSSVLYDTQPSLAIVLINPATETRWVIIAAP